MKNSYPCLVPGCTSLAWFYAKDNRAKYGHVCGRCHRELASEERVLYEMEIA